jgi:glycosyltransferase involved in cell wall biosynthesis
MVSHSFYESDNRVMRYAQALAERGDQVEVVALRASPELPERETIRGVEVHRVQSRTRNERRRFTYLNRMLRFLLRSGCHVTLSHWRRPFDLVHVHNVPDFLVFAALWPRLRGCPVILDIHDILPEFYASKFNLSKASAGFRAMLLVERLSTAFASHVIVANHIWHERLLERALRDRKCTVFLNHVDTEIFSPRPRHRSDDRQILLYAGSLQFHQGLDVAIRAVAQLSPNWPKLELHIYGEGTAKPDLLILARELGLNGQVRFFPSVSIDHVPQLMADADLGIVPKLASGFGNEAYSTKIMEFMAVGTPVLASRTRIDQRYFEEPVLKFFESGNPDDLANAASEILKNSALKSQLITEATRYATQQSWATRKADYTALVDRLCKRAQMGAVREAGSGNR